MSDLMCVYVVDVKAVLKVKEASKALETSKEDNKDHLYTQVLDTDTETDAGPCLTD